MEGEELTISCQSWPLGDKKLRACMVTGLVKTEDQFYREGNDNVACLNMAGDREMVQECTSANFDGLIAIMKPNESWCAVAGHLQFRAAATRCASRERSISMW